MVGDDEVIAGRGATSVGELQESYRRIAWLISSHPFLAGAMVTRHLAYLEEIGRSEGFRPPLNLHPNYKIELGEHYLPGEADEQRPGIDRGVRAAFPRSTTDERPGQAERGLPDGLG